MAAKLQPLDNAPSEYGAQGESLFRKTLEEYLFRLSSDVSNIESGQGTAFSLSSKRAMLLMADLGVETIV